MALASVIQLAVYSANQNIERSIGNFNLNIPNTNGSIITMPGLVLRNGGTLPFTAVPGNALTVVTTNVPLSAAITFAASAGGGSLTKTVTQILVLDQEIVSITFTNNDPSNDATVTVVAG